MDSLEVLENKGYTSIAEADYEEGFLESKAEGFLDGINDAKLEMAKAMLLDGLPIKQISVYSGLSEEEIKSL
jgi:predicted transposase/invertase (TIGR01784 family)